MRLTSKQSDIKVWYSGETSEPRVKQGAQDKPIRRTIQKVRVNPCDRMRTEAS